MRFQMLKASGPSCRSVKSELGRKTTGQLQRCQGRSQQATRTVPRRQGIKVGRDIVGPGRAGRRRVALELSLVDLGADLPPQAAARKKKLAGEASKVPWQQWHARQTSDSLPEETSLGAAKAYVPVSEQ